MTLAGVPISLDGQWSGVDGENLTNNQLDLQADPAHLAQVPPVQWPVVCVTYGTEYLVRLLKPPSNTPVSHRRKAGLRLGVDSVLGVDGVNASLLMLSDQHPARGRGIELVIWKVAVLASSSPPFHHDNHHRLFKS